MKYVLIGMVVNILLFGIHAAGGIRSVLRNLTWSNIRETWYMFSISSIPVFGLLLLSYFMSIYGN